MIVDYSATIFQLNKKWNSLFYGIETISQLKIIKFKLKKINISSPVSFVEQTLRKFIKYCHLTSDFKQHRELPWKNDLKEPFNEKILKDPKVTIMQNAIESIWFLCPITL